VSARSPHRSVRIPSLLRLVEGVDAASDALDEITQDADGVLLAVHTGGRSGSGYAPRFIAAAAKRGHALDECVVDAHRLTSVEEVKRRIAAVSPRFVIGIGGGRVVDIAKLAAAERGIDFLSVPTQASSDGLCSPIAVIISDEGRPNSVGARIPAGLIVDMEALRSAPLSTWRSGLGDLVSNVSAVRDWRDAHVRRNESIDDFACLTSEAAALSVIADNADLTEGGYQEKLVRGLILSGIAMEMAGSSRPASGSEHLISHALDSLVERPHLHGLQVALATIATTILRGEDAGWLVHFYGRVGLPVTPADLGISIPVFLKAIRVGPSTRLARSTLLDDISDRDISRLEASYRDGSLAHRTLETAAP